MSSYRRILLASLCATVCIWPVFNLPAHAESLADAVDSAINSHPSVDAAQANSAALDADTSEKRSNYFPQFSAEASGGRIYGDNATSRGLSVTRGAGYSGYGEGSVNLSQRIFDGFETSSRVGAAHARQDSAALNVADVKEDVALRATLAYLDVLRARESLARLKDYGRTLDDYIGRIDKMVKEGGADATLGQQALDIRAQLDNTVVSSQGQLQDAMATYNELVGHVPAESLDRPVPPLDIIPGTAAEAESYAHDHHPTLKAAAFNEKAAQLDSRAEKAAYYPALNGQLSYLKSDEKDLLGGELVDARALIKLNWNYALGGAEQARVRKTLQQSLQSRAQKEDLERQIIRRIEVAYNDSKTSQAQVKIQQQRVSLNENLFNTQKQQFEGAKVNLLQLLQSDNSLFNARLSLMNDDYKALGAQYSILASIGRLPDALKEAPKVAAPPSYVSKPFVSSIPDVAPTPPPTPAALPALSAPGTSPMTPTSSSASPASSAPTMPSPPPADSPAASSATPVTTPVAAPSPSLSSATAPLVQPSPVSAGSSSSSDRSSPIEEQPAETTRPALAPVTSPASSHGP